MSKSGLDTNHAQMFRLCVQINMSTACRQETLHRKMINPRISSIIFMTSAGIENHVFVPLSTKHFSIKLLKMSVVARCCTTRDLSSYHLTSPTQEICRTSKSDFISSFRKIIQTLVKSKRTPLQTIC